MHIAIDIDSTLHHYWDVLSAAARRRFGIELPYDEQFTWGITRLRPEQLAACVADTYTEQRILGAEPYPGAVETVRAWHADGHAILIVSHRDAGLHELTARWLEQIGLPHHELHCSNDKLTRCREVGVDLLIDDSPFNLQGAVENGIRAATLLHPWNAEICEEEDIICADDWPTLAEKLRPIISPAGSDGQVRPAQMPK